MSSLPKVTILMPVYNGETYLKQAIESILNQTFKDFEFLIINDGSTDKSVEIIESYHNPRIRLIHNKKNLGVVASLNKGIELTQGEYIARMDCDDISLPQRFEKQVIFMENHPEIGVCGTAFKIIDQKGNLISLNKFPVGPWLIKWLLHFFCPLAHPTVIMRTSLVKRAGGYNIRAIHCEDYDLWIRLSSITELTNLNNILLNLRKHEQNISTIFLREQQDNVARICHSIFLRNFREDIPLTNIRQLIFNESGTLEDTINNSKLIRKLYNAFIKMEELSNEEKKAIKKDVANRLITLAYPLRKNFRVWSIFIQALRLNPLLILRR